MVRMFLPNCHKRLGYGVDVKCNSRCNYYIIQFFISTHLAFFGKVFYFLRGVIIINLLKKRIVEDGRIEGEDILKVDSFLNHQIDVELFNEIGKEFKRRFAGKKINKILTVEASGIGIACIVAQYFKVPVVFAKKLFSSNLDKEIYSAEVFSYTKKASYSIMVAKRFLNADDNILIIDDFLANGAATQGLIEIINQAGASLEGIGIVIEKGFQDGGKILRAKNIQLESLAIVESFDRDSINFSELCE